MQTEFTGDNIEFTAVDIGDYTIYLNKTEIDTATEKYAQNNPATARRISIRGDQSMLQLGENGVTFTNPMTIIANKEATEKRDVPFLSQIKLRTTVANTAIKVRWN